MTIKTVLRHLSGLLLLAGVASCTSEVLAPEYGPTDEGARSPMRIELGVSASDIGIRTRAAAGDDELSEAFASSEVKSLWVGVFDVQTGNLVGQTAGFNPDSRTATVDILYYDAHPTLRVYGVANYDEVKARRGTDEFSDLGALLKGVRTLTDFYTIAVDAAAANAAAIQSGAPLMMGVFKSKEMPDYHTVAAGENGSFSVSYGEEGSSVTLNDASVGSMYDRIDYKKFDGTIRLRRLLSQVNVTVAGGAGITVSNLHYRKVNMPNEVYLQERQTYTGSTDLFENWRNVTPNKADSLLVTPNPGNPEVGNVVGTPAYESDADFQKVDNGASFRFYQYENKHWGLASTTADNREAVRTMTDFAGDPVFVALCGVDKNDNGDIRTIYNNYASYFEISLDVRDDNAGKSGTVVYRIHEGFCNNENGILTTGNAPDFTCVRNTEYSYNITVKGLDHIDVSVSGNHDAGQNSGVAKSELWTMKDAGTIKDGASVSFNGTILDFVFYSANGGNDPKVFGSDKNSVLFNLPALSGIAWDDDLSGAFTLGGKDLEVDAQAGQVGQIALNEEIKFPEGKYNPKDYRYELYILTAADKMEDGCGAYTYWHVTCLPEDTRDSLGDSVDFDLAFANDWDAAASKTNGAVVGHIKEISIPEIDLDKKDGVEPVYTVVLDGEEVWTGTDLLSQNLYAYGTASTPFSANSVHKVQLVVSDQNDNYSELKSKEKTFVVYPTSFEWNYRSYQAAYFESENGTQGSYYGTKNYQDLHKSEANGSNYFALQQVASNMIAPSTYLQTGGNRNIFHIDPLYDAILTVYAANNTTTPQYEKCLMARYSDSNEEISQSSVGFSTTGNTPFTFYIEKSKGGVDIFSTAIENSSINGNVRIYAVKLEYNITGKKAWKFSDSSWSEYLTYLGDTKREPGHNLSTSINGLGIFTSSEADLRGENDRLYLGNTGTKSKIGFFAHKSGLLQLDVAGSTEAKRMIQVETGNSPFDEKNVALFNADSENAPSVSSKTSIRTSAWIEIDKPTMVYVSVMVGAQSSNGTYFYNVEYDETAQKE